MRSRRAVALVVVIALTANACSSSTRDRAAPTTTTATTTTTTTPAAAAPGQDAMIAELSKAGIEVVDSPVPVTSSAPVTLTHAQVRVMAADADASAGIRGSDLDAAAGGAPTPLPFSSFIGAYVLGVDTPAAAYARTLMGDQDLTVPAHAVFPLVVLALFAADAVAAFDPLTSQPSGFAPARFVGRPAAFETSCSSVTKAIFDGVDEVFAKFQIPHGKVGDTGSSFLNGLLQGLTDIVVAGLNFFVNAAKALVVEGIEYVLDKVLGFVATVAAAAALVSEFVSAVRPWTVKTTVDPAQITKGVDPVYVTATATLSVAAADDEDWPGWFKNCAMAAGVTLPSLLPVGAPVEWKVETRPPDTELLTESSAVFEKNTTLIKQGSQVVAKDGLEAATETQEQVDTGDAMEGAVVVTATVSRRQVRELRDTLIDLAKSLARQVLQPVPAIIRDYLLKLVDEAATSAIGDVAALLDVSSAIAVGVTWPKPKPRPTTIPPTSSPSAASQYCALFIAFANWSLTNLSAITAESSTDSWAARDPYFAEYLVRMAAMQQVAPAQLVDALATLVHFATLYSAHNVAGAAADASAVASAGTTINAYGRTVCGYDPAVSVSG